MNSGMTYEISTTSSADTKSAGHRLSKLLGGGDIVELSSDLGGGKTTFVQGVALGLGFAAPVTSPTFTLSNIYHLADGRELHHYDLYRLGEGGVMADELAEDIQDPEVITIIEWAGVAKTRLPVDRLLISFDVTADTGRRLTFSAGGPNSASILARLKT